MENGQVTSSASPKASRGRGRPQKESTDTEIDLQRSRVRRAQVAYRKRKEAHLTTLERKCKDLEAIIEGMSNEFGNFSERLMQPGKASSETIKDMQDVLSRFLELSRAAAGELDQYQTTKKTSDSDKSLPDIREAPQLAIEMIPRGFPDSIAVTSTSTLESGDSSYQELGYISMQDINLQQFQVEIDSTNIWSPKIDDTDDTIIQHILSGRDSFAARLFFDTINLATLSLAGEVPWRYAESLFRFKLPFINRDKLLTVTSGVLEMLLLGNSQTHYPKAQLADEICMHAKPEILELMSANGETENDYLSAMEVEKYLKQRWMLGVDSNAIHATGRRSTNFSPPTQQKDRLGVSRVQCFAPTLVLGFPQTDQVVLGNGPLLDTLKAAAVTIGAGPRWRIVDVDDIVERFLSGTTASTTLGMRALL